MRVATLFAIPVIVLGFAAHAATPTPSDLQQYAAWPKTIELSCQPLSLTVYETVTPDADKQVLTLKLGDDIVVYDTSVKSETMDEEVTYGLYKGQWLSVKGDDDVAKKRSQRLTKAALLDQGGAPALKAYAGCQSQLRQKLMQDVVRGLKQFNDEMGQALKN